MRTNIELNDTLVTQAMKIANVSTKREAVEAALTAYVRKADHRDLFALFGTNPERWDDDLTLGTRKKKS